MQDQCSSIQDPSSDIRRAPNCLHQSVWPSTDNLNGGWRFDIMLNHLTFVSIPNCLDFCIWKKKTNLYGETGHHSSGLPAAGDQNPPLANTGSPVAPVMGLPATWTSVDKPSVDPCPTFPPKLTPLSSE